MAHRPLLTVTSDAGSAFAAGRGVTEDGRSVPADGHGGRHRDLYLIPAADREVADLLAALLGTTAAQAAGQQPAAGRKAHAALALRGGVPDRVAASVRRDGNRDFHH